MPVLKGAFWGSCAANAAMYLSASAIRHVRSQSAAYAVATLKINSAALPNTEYTNRMVSSNPSGYPQHFMTLSFRTLSAQKVLFPAK
jgi:hypothetical protein